MDFQFSDPKTLTKTEEYKCIYRGDFEDTDAVRELVSVEELTGAATLYHVDRNGLYHLVCCKALTARGTFAAALYTGSVFYGTGIKYS